MKKNLIAFALFVLVAGCANNIVLLGNETYRITKLPTESLQDEVAVKNAILIEAKQHCLSLDHDTTVRVNSWSITNRTKFELNTELQNVELVYSCKG